ncbi:hypothetical protein ES708_32999 [subsurface metagenome]
MVVMVEMAQAQEVLEVTLPHHHPPTAVIEHYPLLAYFIRLTVFYLKVVLVEEVVEAVLVQPAMEEALVVVFS